MRWAPAHPVTAVDATTATVSTPSCDVPRRRPRRPSRSSSWSAEEFLSRYGSVRMQGANSTDPLVANTRDAVESGQTEYAKWRDDTELRAVIGDDDYRAGADRSANML